ncbi:MAG: phosphate ABC transporter substrate-binding protein PstS, partial [Candidatus Dormibacteraceae bacterium]
MRRLGWLSAVVGGTVLLASCGGTSSSNADVGKGNLTGAGSTFVEPFYNRAFYEYTQEHNQVTINYQAIGSGGGIQQITKNTVDFGATDVPMDVSEVAAAGGTDSLVQLPTTLGVISLAYNLPGVQRLNLDGATISGIYLGQIKRWNDPALQSLNSNRLPALDIKVAHRSDGSGTSYAFTDYLAKESPDWKSKVGVGKSVNWPLGVGGKGNEVVGSLVKQ